MTSIKNIGILGGGQLGRMLAESARNMEQGFRCIIWEPSKDGCAFEFADEKIVKPYDDKDALKEFIEKVDVVVLEFENIPVEVVQKIEKKKKLVAPSSSVLSIVQDRVKEKTFFNDNGIPCVKWHLVDSEESALDAREKVESNQLILKTCRLGYDGKGQKKLLSNDNIVSAWKDLGEVPCIAEEFVHFFREFSVIGARNESREMVFYDIAQNLHLQGILYNSSAPTNLSKENIDRAKQYIYEAMEALDIVGLLALEMFFDHDNKLIANEMAARPHNSGHWTMDGAETSQFEQCIRAAVGLPFGSCKSTHIVEMRNLLGDDIRFIGKDTESIKFHDYKKCDIREGRKMGHINHLYGKL